MLTADESGKEILGASFATPILIQTFALMEVGSNLLYLLRDEITMLDSAKIDNGVGVWKQRLVLDNLKLIIDEMGKRSARVRPSSYLGSKSFKPL